MRVAKLLADPTHLMPFGLCSVALDVENGHTHLFFRMRDRARDHVIALHGQEGSCYAYPRGEEREARILASLWMALEAAEECR